MVAPVLRVLVVDDNDHVRYGLNTVLSLSDDIEIVGEARNGQEALKLCERLQPDLVLMDLGMPVMDGVTATRFLRQHLPHIRILILTSGTDPDLAAAAIAAGAHGYMDKRVDIDALIKSLQSAMA